MKNIFVGNLSFAVTESELKALFEGYGSVERVAILTDRDSGRSRGFGFVEMPVDSEAENAIAELNGREWSGRPLKVNEALPKTEGGGHRGGGGGFNRGGGSQRNKRREPRW